MPTWNGAFNGRAFNLRLNFAQGTQSIASNSTNYSWSLEVVRTGSSDAWEFNPSAWSVVINGQAWNGNWTYDFRGTSVGSSIMIAAGSGTATHNADGTKSIAVNSSASGAGYIGYAESGSGGANVVLTTIARASNPTFTTPLTVGTNAGINMNRASTSFTHTVFYTFGSLSGTIGTGVTDTVYWSVPRSLLTAIPNSATGVGTMGVHTYNGGTLIGTTYKSMTISVSATDGPSLSATAATEAAFSPTLIGAYVQGVSRLNLALTGITTQYGATTASAKITIDGQTINSTNGTMSSPITKSGTVTATSTITDTRGKTATRTDNFNVLPYVVPSLINITAQRSNAAGTPTDSGTYIRVNINAKVQALPNGGEKNAMAYQIWTRLRGATTWTDKGYVSMAAGVVAFNSNKVISTYQIDKAFEVLVRVSDRFASSEVTNTVATSSIFQHWDASTGVGIGKYREFGMLDVLGQIYQNNGQKILDEVQGFTIRELVPTNWDSATSPGAYRVANQSATNHPVGAYMYGILEVVVASSDMGIQQIYHSDLTQVYTRQKWATANAWRPWTRVFDASATPFAQSEGKVALNLLGVGGQQTLAVTFPSGRFSQAPSVMLTSYSTRYSLQVTEGSVTTSGFSIIASNFSGGGASSGSFMGWSATQMSSGSGVG